MERIRAEKEELIKQGKIKRDNKESIIFKGADNSYYEKIGDKIKNIDDEIPFELPDGWGFVRLKELWELISGRDLSPSEYNADVNAPYQVPYKLKAASAALLHCFFDFLTTSGNFSDHGSRSSKNDRSLSSMRLGISVRRCSKYSYGFRLFAFAVSAML